MENTTTSAGSEVARRLPGRVAWPLYPSDAACSLFTLCAGLGEPVTNDSLGGAVEDALATIARLLPLLDHGALREQPPAVLARLRAEDHLVFVPLTFGYTTYARADPQRPPVRFGDVPTFGPGQAGGLLGGAGLALSAQARQPEEAARFAAWYAGAQTQRDLALPAGGRPASRTVWDDPAADAQVGGFFSGTRRSMDLAPIRPRDAWWPGFQAHAGRLLARALETGERATTTGADLRALHATHRRGARRVTHPVETP